MKKIVIIVLVAGGCLFGATPLHAQTKMGYISLSELIQQCPSTKKQTLPLVDYQTALNQNFDDMKSEFNEQDSLLSSKDTAKYTKAQTRNKKKTSRRTLPEIAGIPAAGEPVVPAEAAGIDGAHSEKGRGNSSAGCEGKWIHLCIFEGCPDRFTARRGFASDRKEEAWIEMILT